MNYTLLNHWREKLSDLKVEKMKVEAQIQLAERIIYKINRDGDLKLTNHKKEENTNADNH
jgi:hypothetical protein